MRKNETLGQAHLRTMGTQMTFIVCWPFLTLSAYFGIYGKSIVQSNRKITLILVQIQHVLCHFESRYPIGFHKGFNQFATVQIFGKW